MTAPNGHVPTHPSNLPVAVIGAGPVGLAAAAHLVQRNQPFVVLEAGPVAGATVNEWAHVHVFSPWRYNIDPAARTLLEANGWTVPDEDAYPTGSELIRHYLAPLAAHPAIAPHVRYNSRVIAISRDTIDKVKNADRGNRPFALHLAGNDGSDDEIIHARAVIDASGTWAEPNPLGANGLPVPGERALHDRIWYGIPDVLGQARDRYAGKRVLVVGSGHSAFNALQDLVVLAEQEPGTQVLWAIRRASTGEIFGGGADDALPERGALGRRIQALTATGHVRLFTGVRITRLRQTPTGIRIETADETAAPELGEVDEIVAATGFRPDLAMLRELRLNLDSAVESPTALAPLIDPNIHSCGTVPPHGAEQLRHPEPDFYIAGMKSYGRAPTFLMLTGYEQVRSIVAALAGDWEAARKVELVLPQTGVCSGPGGMREDAASSGCCGTVEESATIAAATGCCDDPTLPAGQCCGSTPELIQIGVDRRPDQVGAVTRNSTGSSCC